MVEEGSAQVINRDADGNPVCPRCGEGIADKELHFVAWDPRHPEIEMGPYHEECWPYVKVCTVCHTPHMVDDEEQIKHYGNGVWACSTCARDLKICSQCGNTDNLIEVKGKRICSACFRKKYVNCEVLKEVRDKFSFSPLVKMMYSTIFEEYSSISEEGFLSIKDKYTPEPVFTCKSCGEICSGGEQGYCQECIDEGDVYTCKGCGILDHHYNRDMRGYCPSCSTKYVRSFISKEICKKSEMVEVKGIFESSYHLDNTEERKIASSSIECPICHTIQTKDRVIKRGSITYCTHCEEKLKFCSSCNKPHMGESHCRSERSEFISNYSWKPLPIFHLSTKERSKIGRRSNESRLVMGFENEQSYSSTKKMNKELNSIYSRFSVTELYCKSDSSITGHGFEVVTHPYTLDAFRSLPLSYLFKVKPLGGSNGCGMHVHLNKSFFGNDTHLYKFINFINHSDNKGYMRKIAGRYDVSYSKKTSDDEVSKRIKDKNMRRHSFVNLSNRKTVEVRIFKGAESRVQIMYRIEFCHALATWSRSSSLKVDKDNFNSFVRKEWKEYPNLVAFLGLKSLS